MCGIVGYFSPNHPVSPRLLKAMTATLEHRGPDDHGTWLDETVGIALGHRRLAILELSPQGHQPMHSFCGRYVMVFNGEIYNHLELRRKLQQNNLAPPWRGRADTETLLASFAAWGVEATLQASIGMFAIALWDRQTQTLTLARDRFGEKPLYYGWSKSTPKVFLFASELSALRVHPHFTNPIDRNALALYLRHTYIPAPHSIYQQIYKLEPGCFLTLNPEAVSSPPSESPFVPYRQLGCQLKRWYDLSAVAIASQANLITDSQSAIDQLAQTLSTAVQSQTLADAPLGAFLSGGIDSSTVVALMQAQSSRPVQTFTIGFQEAGFDEAGYAQAVANHLGTEHHSLDVSAADAQAIVPRLPQLYNEPFADSSQIPTHLVASLARQKVTVALSGDGGDELFGGYNRYFWNRRLGSRLAWIPPWLRRLMGQSITAIPTAKWDSLGEILNVLNSRGQGLNRLGEKAHKLANRLKFVDSLDDLYLSLVSEWLEPTQVVIGAQEPVTPLRRAMATACDFPHESRMMLWDTLSYLPDDILCKVDRAAMGCSLETRVPMLDPRVVALAWQLPLELKIQKGVGKWALRQVLYRHVPRELIERPKAGFAIPVGQWLRSPLREWAETLLAPQRLRNDGYFQVEPIARRWSSHLAGQDWTASLWTVLQFNAWLDSWH